MFCCSYGRQLVHCFIGTHIYLGVSRKAIRYRYCFIGPTFMWSNRVTPKPVESTRIDQPNETLYVRLLRTMGNCSIYGYWIVLYLKMDCFYLA